MNADFLEVDVRLQAAGYALDGQGVYRSGRKGYWSNLNKEDNEKFLEVLKSSGPIEAVRNFIPQYENIIFSPCREAGLELLDIREGNIGIDYGCMWGVLSVGMAKRGARVIAIDQTSESLEFLVSRSRFSNLNNVVCVQDDIREVRLPGLADFSVVNGVLEWVPEFGEIELNKYYGKKHTKDYGNVNPEVLQQQFLEHVSGNLKDNGKLYLAIENRFDYTHFLGKPDPHPNLLFTAILPRKLSDLISRIRLGRPYVNYIYSFQKIKDLLLKSGFKKVDLYMAYPDYRFPALILPYEGGVKKYRKYWEWNKLSLKKKAAYSVEYALMRIFKARFFAPSIIAIAEK